MRSKEDLHRLIKSLSQTEKRHFRIFSSSGSRNKNYLNLFNEIDSQGIYNELEIRKKFAGQKFLKQLTFTKYYLQKQILKSLLNYNSEKSIDLRLNNLVFKAQLLFDKALYSDFKRTTSLGILLSKKYERFEAALKFLELEKIWIYRKLYRNEDTETIFKTEEEILKKINNLNEYYKIVSSLEKNYRERGVVRSKEDLSFLNNKENCLLLKNERSALSERARELRLYALQLIEDTKVNCGKILKYSTARLNLIKKNPLPFEGRGLNYYHDILFYVILNSIRLNKYEKIDSYFKFLKRNTRPTLNDRISYFLIESAYRMQKVFINKKWAEGLALIKEIESEFEKYQGKIEYDLEMLLYNNFSTIYLVNEKYNECLKCLNFLLNNPRLKLRPDVEFRTRIFFLITHYELKNYDLLQHLIKSTYLYLNKRKLLHKTEKRILTFLKKIPDIKSVNDFMENLVILKKDMLKLKKDPYERRTFSYNEYLFWIDKQLNKVK